MQSVEVDIWKTQDRASHPFAPIFSWKAFDGCLPAFTAFFAFFAQVFGPVAPVLGFLEKQNSC
jgi:hypothetical protein